MASGEDGGSESSVYSTNSSGLIENKHLTPEDYRQALYDSQKKHQYKYVKTIHCPLVFKVCKKKKYYAIKVRNMTYGYFGQPLYTASIHKMLFVLGEASKEFFVKYVEDWISKDRKWHFCVMENIEDGYTALDYVKDKFNCAGMSLSPRQYIDVFVIFHHMCTAVAFMHNFNVAHKDIKLENVLMKKDMSMIKLCDFEYSAFCRNGELYIESQGSPLYGSPEMFLNAKAPHTKFTCDIWALGVCLCVLLVQKMPFGSQKFEEGTYEFLNTIKDDVMSGNNKCILHISNQHIRSLLKKMLNLDWRNRCTINDVLNDKWVVYMKNLCLNQYS